MPPPPDDEPWFGRIIDERYRVEALLGEGGMGAVFLAEQVKLQKKVALKVILPEFAGDGDVAERFGREAMASGRIEHPHVASAIDYGTLPEGGAYLVMQYIRGESLADLLDKGPVNWVRACEVGAQIADALAAAHAKGVVHRDLKPDNVMLEPQDGGNDHVKVLDFGIARVGEDGSNPGGKALTRVGTVIGTPGYMAPEQALGETVDARVDIYALGLLFHEMITGEPLFKDTDLTAIVTWQLTQTAPNLAEITEGDPIPLGLAELVARMLSKDRDDRPASAGEIRDALRALLLSATLHAMSRSGEHSLPGTLGQDSGSGNVARDPTPLAINLARLTGDHPSLSHVGTAATVAAAPSPLDFADITGGRLPIEPPAASTEQSTAAPKALLAAAGAGALLVLIMMALGIGWLFSDDPQPTALVKVISDRSLVAAPEDDAGSVSAVPEALAAPMVRVLLSETRRERRLAATEIRDHEPAEEVPPFLIAVANLERSRNCRRKREFVESLGEIGDVRGLPALERLEAAPRNGCRRMLRRIDCWACLREPLGESLSTLRAQLDP